MNGAQPVNKHTGEHGPICGSATAAVFWILAQPDAADWTWESIPAARVPETAFNTFLPVP